MDETKKKKPDEGGEPDDNPKDNAEAPEDEKKDEPLKGDKPEDRSPDNGQANENSIKITAIDSIMVCIK